MADIAIYVSLVQESGGQLLISGVVYAAGGIGTGGSAEWSTLIEYGDLSTSINAAIRDAAIAAAEAGGATVGPVDKKTLFCGAQGI